MRIRVGIALAAAGLVLQMCLGAAAQVTMTITSPSEGQTVARPYFRARLTGVTELVVVRVDFAGTTHFIMVRPVPPDTTTRPGQRAVEPGADDSWLPIVPGKQELTASVLSVKGKEIVAKQRVTLTVAPQSDAELAQGIYGFNKIYSMLNGAANTARESWANFCTSVDAASRSNTGESWEAVRYQAKLYMATRSDEFHARTRAYAELADIYVNAGRPADAMRAAEEADRIYRAERLNTSSGEFFGGFPVIYDPRPAQNVGSPAHFACLARLYVMKGDLETACSWYQKAIDFQNAQAEAAHLDAGARQRCRDEAGATYRQAAGIVFLLTNDMTRYQRWIDAASLTSAGNASNRSGVNLLNQ